jgi:hypothetical protein
MKFARCFPLQALAFRGALESSPFAPITSHAALKINILL